MCRKVYIHIYIYIYAHSVYIHTYPVYTCEYKAERYTDTYVYAYSCTHVLYMQQDVHLDRSRRESGA